MRHDQANQPGESQACQPASGEVAAGALARRAAHRGLPMGSLIAALLVAMWFPSGPLMAAALITGEAAALHSGMSGANAGRTGPKHAPRHGDLRTLKLLSAALVCVVRSGQVGDGFGLMPVGCFGATDEAPLDRLTDRAQRWANTADDLRDDRNAPGLPGGVRAARNAGLIALPPPSIH